MNFFYEEEYFKFDKWKYGPYAYSIEIISKNIKEYQEYYGFDNSEDTFKHVYQVICSDRIDRKFKTMHLAIQKATKYVNKISTDKQLEGIATVLYLVQNVEPTDKEGLVRNFRNWSNDKAKRFSIDEIVESIDNLESNGIISLDICGNYELSRNALK